MRSFSGTANAQLAAYSAMPSALAVVSVVRDLLGNAGAHAIIRANNPPAAALVIETLAEGLKLASYMEVSRSDGCDMIQGYLISHLWPANA